MIKDYSEFINKADFSFLRELKVDPDSDLNGKNWTVREVSSGHYVPVIPKRLDHPIYVAHSKVLFEELGISNNLIKDKYFCRLFSGDLEEVKHPMKPYGWATGYALSIYGTEYVRQCPFGTGNGYGDGRAISIFEGIFKSNRWEMQLKGGGPTPYCRGGDGRAVLRSSIREFLAQELMHALGIPTSRSLTLFTSESEKVLRPWYSEESKFLEPDILLETPVAITTRVAPSFLRVGHLELYFRRFRSQEHQNAENDLRMIVKHLIFRNYKDTIDQTSRFSLQLVELISQFRDRLTSLVSNWIRVGYCQGNFNSDNCSAGGYTLDYGPFGFCELFDPSFQPWTGGGKHFSFLNQSYAAEANFRMFCNSLKPLIETNSSELKIFEDISNSFSEKMDQELQKMWTRKIGLKECDEFLINELIDILSLSKADFTKFFRILSEIPDGIDKFKQSFYYPLSKEVEIQFLNWFMRWRELINKNEDLKAVSAEMKLINPKFSWREWLVASAYQKAEVGDYSEVYELLEVFSNPYDEHSNETQEKYDQLRPLSFFNKGGISHYSCSS